jgi:hypothetical protein
MRRLLVFAILLALLGSSVALASVGGDPEKRINPADQARARAMLVRKSDLGPGYRVLPSGSDVDSDCAALDESDLMLTGEAQTSTFASGLLSIASNAGVYRSVADANASWRRGTSAAGLRCLQDATRREYAKQRLQLRSFRKIAFPRVAERTVALRIVFEGQSQGLNIRLYLDVIAMKQSRAEAAVAFGSAIDPLERGEQVRLARLVAGRMAKAMRGA